MDKKQNKNNFFFNHKGIKGHVACDKKPTKKTLEALLKMIELAAKMKTELAINKNNK